MHHSVNCLENRTKKTGKFCLLMCMIKILGGEGVVDGEGGSSERCLNWGGGGWGWGSLRDLSKPFKTGGG